ncbi:MAG: GGDEF domain-containing protein [Burkholderiaceae bacterium]|nr:GGDEF domain-containing protein [Burkholderiaceae bacterium]
MSDRMHFETAAWATIAVLAWATSSYFNVSETIAAFIRDHAAWQLDEMVTLVVFLSVSAFITSFCQSRRHLRIRRAAEKEAFVAARRDVLTGLPNRQMFLELAGKALGEAWQSQQKCAVLFIDLDGFKPINDTLGHAAGDEALKVVAERLRHALAANDFVARLGGDEFVVIARAIAGPEAALTIAERLLESIGQPMTLLGHPSRMGASIGIALLPRGDTRSASEILSAADHAMYAAKRGGKGRAILGTSA